MSTYIKNITIVFMAFFALSSCYKDKGNYDFTAVNDVYIDIPDSFTVKQGQLLEITPTLNFNLTDQSSNLSFEWVVAVPEGTSNDSSLVVLSTERNISVQVNYPAGNTYPLSFKVTDNSTGITYRKKMVLMMITDLQPGFFVLEKTAGRGDISFINTQKDSIVKNLFSTLNPDIILPETVHGIFVKDIPKYNFSAGGTSYSYPASNMSMVLFKDGGYVFDYRSGKVISKYEDLFLNAPEVVKPESFYLDYQSCLLTFNNGKMYRMSMNKGQNLFVDASIPPVGNEQSYLAPYIGGYASSTTIRLLYDKANHRWLNEGVSSLGLTEVTTSDLIPEKMVGLDLLTFKYGFGGTYSYAVFHNASAGTNSLYTFSYASLNNIRILDSTPGIEKSPDFIFSNNRYIMYYAIGNQLFLYDILANSSRSIYTLSAGENIRTLISMDNNTIAIGTYGSEGSVYVFALSGTGDITNGTASKTYHGLGEIVKIVYKS
ncbi:PKD-like family protein [bacterium A37T11]|nr:PKD-like family protein [bacterium A37T11]